MSLIVTLHNSEDYIEAFLQSLSSQKAQIKKLTQLVFVETGESDNSRLKAREWAAGSGYNVEFINSPSSNPSATRNQGITVAEGDWISFPDPDDLLSKKYLLNVAKEVLGDFSKEVDFISCRMNVLDDLTGQRRKHWHDFRFKLDRRTTRVIGSEILLQTSVASMFIRLDTLKASQLSFNELIFPNFEDANFIGRLFAANSGSSIAWLRRPIYTYRKRGNGTSLSDFSARQPSLFLDVIREGIKDMLLFAAERNGSASSVPTIVQVAAIWEIAQKVSALKNLVGGEAGRGSDLDRATFAAEVDECLRYLDLQVLARCATLPLDVLALKTLRLRKAVIEGDRALGGVSFESKGLTRRGIQFVADTFPQSTLYLCSNILCRPVSPTRVKNHYFGDEIQWTSVSVSLLPPLGESWWFSLDGQVLPPNQSMRQNLGLLEKLGFSLNPPENHSHHMPHCGTPQLLLQDSVTRAGDNAEALAYYLLASVGKKSFNYVLSKKSPDWSRLSALGFPLLEFSSSEHIDALRGSAALVTSYLNPELLYPDGQYARPPLYFLGHGVSEKDVSKELNQHDIKFLAAGLEFEYQQFVSPGSNYKTPEESVYKTGLARWDRLEEASGDEDILLVAPTWRSWLTKKHLDDEGLLSFEPSESASSSQYWKEWTRFLQSPLLEAWASAQGLKVVLLAHPVLMKAGLELPTGDFVTRLSRLPSDYSQLINRSKFLITDYSSLAFDFAVTGKPTLYYQFDSELFFARHYKRGNFDYKLNGFGPVFEFFEQAESYFRETRGLQMTEKIRDRLTDLQVTYMHKKNAEHTFLAIQTEILARIKAIS